VTAGVAVAGVSVVRSPAARWDANGRRVAPPADWFDYRKELGHRGYKYVPDAFRYLLAAARGALADAGCPPVAESPEDGGLIVGTNSAVARLHAGMDRTVIAEHADELSPAAAPYFSINVGGGRLATEHALKGYHATLTTPRVAGLEAIALAGRALALGRTRWMLVGATEDRLDPAEPAAARSESGAVVLVAYPPARSTRGMWTCRVHSRFLAPGVAEGPALTAALAAVTPEGAAPVLDGAAAVVAVLDESPVGAALAAELDGRARIVPAGAGCLEPLAQVADALLDAAGPVVVVTAAAEGNLAVALVSP
jgi:3-oxoacyl-[acyl-carrier-protein] synthase II